MSAAVKAASTAVETATTMESASTASVEATAAVEPAACTAVETTAGKPAAACERRTAPTEASTAESTVKPATKSTASIESASAEAVEPWTSADENATDKPIRTVVAIGCTSIRVIPVIAVGAGRSGTYINWSNPNANRHLRVRRHGCREHANCQ